MYLNFRNGKEKSIISTELLDIELLDIKLLDIELLDIELDKLCIKKYGDSVSKSSDEHKIKNH
ncbi:hypothetical protein ASJ81_08110 [Methanosarcina spelaei]|uniref:Uncharacterized protein n=1 Tax=Methanosarcina spelaei TaxID=1036679 RepID=A0A2A2HRS7_9EURY|nr:hypothetical protein ASJ81_08110 [Methanosarcina spelaei]